MGSLSPSSTTVASGILKKSHSQLSHVWAAYGLIFLVVYLFTCPSLGKAGIAAHLEQLPDNKDESQSIVHLH